MPSPIAANSPTVALPPVHIGSEDGPAPASSSSPPTVTIPPVYIDGEAESAQRLMKAHDAAHAPRSCLSERVTAAYGALEVVGAAGATVLGTALGPWGIAVGLAGVSGTSFEEGQKLRALYNCETE